MAKGNKRIRRKVGKNGRNAYGPGHVRHYHYLLDSPAYQDLRPVARCVYMFLKRLFNGNNNGHLYASTRVLAKAVKCSKDTANDALAELQSHGFIRCAQRGSFHYKIAHAPRWILTEYEYNGSPPTKDFMQWQAPEKKCRSRSKDNLSLTRDTPKNSVDAEQRTVPNEGHSPAVEQHSRSPEKDASNIPGRRHASGE